MKNLNYKCGNKRSALVIFLLSGYSCYSFNCTNIPVNLFLIDKGLFFVLNLQKNGGLT